jgi:DNA repair exonuclease SbcCD ATPase subunit
MSALNFISMTIKNFKAFKGEHEFTLDRAAGLYYISGVNKAEPELGANGVGKSTLWDGLNWCFWGHTIRDARPADAIVPWDVQKQTTSIAVKFERLRKVQTLRRSRKPNALTLIRKNSEHELEQDEIADLLGMSEETFRRTIILGQFGALFLDLRPEAQSQMFNEALPLEVWLKAATIATRERKRYENDINELRQSIARHKGQLEEIDASIEHETKASADYDAQLEDKIAALSKTLQDKRRALGALAG